MKHFLDLAACSRDELQDYLELALQLKAEWRAGGNQPILRGKTLGMIFQKPSLRTRVSFEMGMKHLGGDAIMLGPQEIGLGVRETVPDVARVLSSYVQGIMARVYDHSDVMQLARHSRVPVINGLSDDYHPCQALADMLTIHEHFGRLQGIKLAFVGDGNNVAASVALACAQFGLDFRIATPEGYEMKAHIREQALDIAARHGSPLLMCTRPEMALADADVVYTDTWISMGQEAESAERMDEFTTYQVNAGLLQKARPDSIVMHCLPAHRGQEITDDVMDGESSRIFEQAENRLHAQKAILARLLG
ncbi:MAG: ornithine carbamoyltransferase [Chloroflexi bacterium]|nr:ornithine carbamoyltransferase [Chloroflexota bacterium]MCY3583217.1 ornithine carbamoyltransferase [Chloroflexota bacterium]MCY3715946.1 ornithine carbamoyltransferase [Chloroflexota bacterium]MDE2651517.1 ornithine carbamoyltransferase [Chloroflexota bacterium]MXV93468.1 ornithine carbamoyltransferase [Chloroflexota bacterium]